MVDACTDHTIEFSEYGGIGFGIGILDDGSPDPHLAITIDDTKSYLETTEAATLAVDILIHVGVTQTLAALWETISAASKTGRVLTDRAKRTLISALMERTSHALRAQSAIIGERLIAQAFSCDLTDVAGALEPLLARLAGEEPHE